MTIELWTTTFRVDTVIPIRLTFLLTKCAIRMSMTSYAESLIALNNQFANMYSI